MPLDTESLLEYVVAIRFAERLIMATMGAALVVFGARLVSRPPRASGRGKTVDMTASGEGRAGKFQLSIARLLPSGLIILVGLAVGTYAFLNGFHITVEASDGNGDAPASTRVEMMYADQQLVARLAPPLGRDDFDELAALADSLSEGPCQSDALRATGLLAKIYESGRLTAEQRARREELRSAKRVLTKAESLELQILNRRYDEALAPR